MKTFTVVDLETSHIDPVIGSIVSLGAVSFDDPKIRFYEECRIFDGAEVFTGGDGFSSVSDIHGFSEEAMRDSRKKTEAELIESFFTWIKDNNLPLLLAGQNIHFDRNFIDHAVRRAGFAIKVPWRVFDLHTLAATKIIERGGEVVTNDGLPKVSSHEVQKLCNLPKEGLPHHALRDALWEVEAFSRLLFGRGLLEDFQDREVPKTLVK